MVNSNNPLEVGLLVPFWILNGEIRLFFQLRNGGKLWEFPGGKLDSGESPKQAVIRETFEETGNILDVNRVIYFKNYLNIFPNNIHLHVFLYNVKGTAFFQAQKFLSMPLGLYQIFAQHLTFPANERILRDLFSASNFLMDKANMEGENAQ